jgi:hypothetical protein
MAVKLPGWNYDHFKPNGRNVVIYQDTNHIDIETQEKIASELEQMISKGFFEVLFTEGCSGVFEPNYNFANEDQFKDYLIKTDGFLGSVELVRYRLDDMIRNKKLIIYGVEDQELHQKQLKLTKKLAEMGQAFREYKDDSKLTEFSKLFKEWNQLTHQRSIYSTRVIQDQMNSRGIMNAGLVYGQGHFETISGLLMAEDIGYISFFPGETKLNMEEDALKYAAGLGK